MRKNSYLETLLTALPAPDRTLLGGAKAGLFALASMMLFISMPSVRAERPQQLERIDQVQRRCDIHTERSTDEIIYESGAPIEVAIDYRVECNEPSLATDIVMVIDVGSIMEIDEAGETGEVDFDKRDVLVEGLKAFLSNYQFEGDSRLGIIQHWKSEHSELIELGYDAETALEHLEILGLRPDEEEVLEGGADAAIDLARTQVAAAGEDGSPAMGMVFVYDGGTGFPLNGAGEAINPNSGACTRLAESGIRGVVVANKAAGGRITACGITGRFLIEGREETPDLKATFDRAGLFEAHPELPQTLEIGEDLIDRLEYIEDSSEPREPDVIALDELVWISKVETLIFEGQLRYKIQAKAGFGDFFDQTTSRSMLTILQIDGEQVEHPMERPVICINFPGRTEYCVEWLRTRGPNRLFMPSLRFE